ncbi:hypothetical protein E2C01_069690 [Portunus trituberculatus]|uniref:Uncharacterized protein n=1 Tax=Portunus trituberculatus TaxID=210409 RepID=A0A5B7I3H3_PORTR|nr:hypothetical protein [Portunus trituberculatus]
MVFGNASCLSLAASPRAVLGMVLPVSAELCRKQVHHGEDVHSAEAGTQLRHDTRLQITVSKRGA